MLMAPMSHERGLYPEMYPRRRPQVHCSYYYTEGGAAIIAMPCISSSWPPGPGVRTRPGSPGSP